VDGFFRSFEVFIPRPSISRKLIEIRLPGFEGPQIKARIFFSIRNPQSEIRNFYLLFFSPTVPSTQSSVTRATE
jgi:hypothetical protein